MSNLDVNVRKGKKQTEILVLLLYRSKFVSGVTRMPSSNQHFVRFELDKIFFDLQKDIFDCGAYIPLSNSVHFKDQEIDIFDQLHSDIVKYSATDQSL